jgi:signal transduction histidine kinase/DNA-binding NarL/FixJ family response regulator
MAKVLIADDRPANREFLATLLGYGGHELLEAGDGAEALAMVRSKHPDLVIADVLMPVMDGYEFVRQLRADSEIAGTRVIFYTASYHERESRALAESCGVLDVITKPAEPQHILGIVARVLAGTSPVNTPPEDFDREHLRLITDKLSGHTYELEAGNQQLGDLLELSRLLASERNAEQLLARFCSAVRKIIGARFAFLGVFSAGDRLLKPLFISGLDPRAVAAVGPMDAGIGILAALSDATEPLLLNNVSGDSCVAALPPPYFPERALIGIRLSTSSGMFGVLWFLEKMGRTAFSRKDAKILASSVAQASIAYENAQRYQQIQDHAAEQERYVAERTAQLCEANQELEAFNYSVAHDLRAPLRNIHGYAQVLLEDLGGDLPLQSLQCLNKIQESTEKMTTLLNDLLDLSRVGRKTLERKLISLDSVLAEVLQDLAQEQQGRHIEWKISPLPHLECDLVLIKQVFVNLVSNAIKYSRTRTHAVIEIGTLGDDRLPVIFVRDNGVGFAMEQAYRLFGVFQRLHRSDEFEGTGAGLAIVQRIIQKHGGRVWIEAALDKGATAFFTVSGSSQSRPGGVTVASEHGLPVS